MAFDSRVFRNYGSSSELFEFGSTWLEKLFPNPVVFEYSSENHKNLELFKKVRVSNFWLCFLGQKRQIDSQNELNQLMHIAMEPVQQETWYFWFRDNFQIAANNNHIFYSYHNWKTTCYWNLNMLELNSRLCELIIIYLPSQNSLWQSCLRTLKCFQQWLELIQVHLDRYIKIRKAWFLFSSLVIHMKVFNMLILIFIINTFFNSYDYQ